MAPRERELTVALLSSTASWSRCLLAERRFCYRIPIVCAVFLYNPEVVHFNYGVTHPFRLERLWLTEYLCRRLGLFDGSQRVLRTFDPADRSNLRVAHSSSYLDALQGSSDGLMFPGLYRYGLGSGDNPIFPGLWDYVLHTAGGSLQGAELIVSGEARRVFHPGGGLHHAMPDRASGFCYVNDVVLAIHRLLDAGKRVFYLDLDAHHGDGVQNAFYERKDVLTLSVHQDGRTLFPGGGFVQEIGRGDGLGASVNVPLMPHMSDADYLRTWDEVIDPLFHAFGADVVVTELGADALAGDPLANLELGLRTWWEIMGRIASWDIHWLAVGGGGYDLANAMRAWTLAWAAMVGVDVPDELPPAPDRLVGCAADMSWPRDMWSSPVEGLARRPSDEVIAELIRQVREQVFPYHGL